MPKGIVLITGINGFLGNSIGKELISSGFEVIGLDQAPACSLTGVNSYFSASVLDKEKVNAAVSRAQFVVHLASLTTHDEITFKPYLALEVAIVGTKNVLDAFVASPASKMFLFSSSGKVYGRSGKPPLDESMPANPTNFLGKSKLLVEQLISFYSTEPKSFVAFRIFNVFGPGQRDQFLIPTVAKQLRHGNLLKLGDLRAKRDYVYVDDIARAFRSAIESSLSNGFHIYNICSGVASSASDILDLFSSITGKKIQAVSQPSLLRPDELDIEFGSFLKIEKDLGWKPVVSLREGLKNVQAP
ncbi:MAG: NAD(P)-dependent oxidoreductase [Candidatus Woesearchaeota archaeon]